MLILKPGEICPYSSRCSYSDNCQGTISGRDVIFTCDFVKDSGEIMEGKFRNKFDLTGKMQLVVESS